MIYNEYSHSTMRSISLSLSILCLPNGGILERGLNSAASQINIRNFFLSGKRAFMAISGGAILPGCRRADLSPLNLWHAMQLPFRLSVATQPPAMVAELFCWTHTSLLGISPAAFANEVRPRLKIEKIQTLTLTMTGLLLRIYLSLPAVGLIHDL